MTTIVAKYHWLPFAGKLFGSRSLRLPVDLFIVCLWAATGLILTALVATFDASADIAGILAAAG